MSTEQPMGEVLPAHVIQQLRAALADRVWDAMAAASVTAFEQWHRDGA